VVYSWPSLLNSSGDSLNQYHDLGINTMIYWHLYFLYWFLIIKQIYIFALWFSILYFNQSNKAGNLPFLMVLAGWS
jgi:hypothetical protein